MIRGLYTAAAGMDIQQARVNVISHNLANVTTSGYKKDVLAVQPFKDFLLVRQERNRQIRRNGRPIGEINLGPAIAAIKTNWGDGPLLETGLSTDLAIEGEGFFTIDTSRGIRYTRNGSFSVDKNGYLTTAEGAFVLGEKGPLKVQNKEFCVRTDGVIVNGQQEIDKLALVAFDDPGILEKEGDNYFLSLPQAFGQAGILPYKEKTPDQLKVIQGFLEKSNVNQEEEMVAMLESLRAYEASQRIMRSQDDLLEKAANQLGSLK